MSLKDDLEDLYDSAKSDPMTEEEFAEGMEDVFSDWAVEGIDHDGLAGVDDAGAGVDHGHVTADTQTFAGDKTFSGAVDISSGKLDLSKTGESNSIDVGEGQTSNQYAYVDMIGDTTYSDYGLRLIRYNTGANARSELKHSGTGNLELRAQHGGDVYLISGSNQGLVVTSNKTLSPSIKDTTTTASANMYISSMLGIIYRTTSSAKYKTDIEDIQDEYSEQIYNMRPVWFRSTCEDDRKDWSHWGLIAEELDKIDKRLVHYGYCEDDYEEIEKIVKEPVTRINAETGKKEVVEIERIEKERVLKKDAVIKPEGVQYSTIPVLILKEVQKHKIEIDKMRQEIDELKAQIAILLNNIITL